MASYTDTITPFSQYVSQLPLIEERSIVGREKQAQYNEGIQRIQDSIDKVAGLPVVREVDKQYLQSKLNSLGTKLKTFVGADYSNFQLTNNVMGMTKQIAEDPNVVNAVYSTQKYKNELDLMEADRKAGKTNPANVYDFTTRASSWLTSTDPTATFSDKYQPPVDYKKKWTEALGKLHTNLSSQDIMNAMDSKGNIDPNRLSAAMTRTKTEGISVSQIQNAINSVMSPEDLNQLSIEGRYTFRGATIGDLQNHAKSEASANLSKIDEQLQVLNAFAKANSSDTESYNKAMASIKSLEERRQYINQNLNSTLQSIQNNPEEEKYNIYKQGVVDSFANSFAWENKIVEHMANPALAAQHWEKEYALSQAKFNLDKDQFTWKQYQDDRQYELDKLESEFKRGVGKKGISGEFTVYKGTSTVVDPPMKSFEKGIFDKEESANKILQDFAKATGNNIGAVEEIYQEYTKGDLKRVPAEWRSEFEDVYKNRQDAKIDSDILAKAKQDASKDPVIQNSYSKILGELSSLSDLNLNIEGRPIKFSQKELYDFLSKEKREATTVYSAVGALGMGLSINPDELNPKEKILYNLLRGSRYERLGIKETPTGNNISKLLNTYSDVMNKSKSINEEINKKTEELLRPTLREYLPTETTIGVDGKTPTIPREDMENLVISTSNAYTEDEQPLMSRSDMKKVQEWIGDKKVKDDLQYKRLEQNGKEWILVVKGTEEIPVPLTSNIASQLPETGMRVSDEEKRIKRRYDAYNGVTNPTGKEDMFAYTKKDFPYVKNFNVSADLAKERKSNNLHHIKLRINIPSIGWKTIPLEDAPMDLTRIRATFGAMTDKDIINIGLELGDSETRQYLQSLNK